MKRATPCLVILLVVFCVLVALGVWAITALPQRAEVAFGPAAPTLGSSQKILLAWQLLQKERELTSPANPFGTEVPFQIELGESPNSVARRLENQNLIPDASAFRDFMVYAGFDTQIQAGDYKISPASPAIEIAYALLDATPAEVPFAILAGWRLEEIAASLPSSGLETSPELFIQEAQHRNLEGYLFPGVYTLPRETTLNHLLEVLAAAFDEAVTSEMEAGFVNQSLSVDDAVRLASIVEREAVVADERPLIASVFLNRLAIGMKLEADPTVQYAVGYQADTGRWWKSPLSKADLELDSPYNTYLYAGLPPGPIASPSLGALQAVAQPEPTDYLFFVVDCNSEMVGQHVFSKTFEEHLARVEACRDAD